MEYQGLTMNKLLLLLLPVGILVSGCHQVSTDLAQAPSNQQISRYGLEHIKLGFPADASIKKINALINTALVCSEKKVAMGKIKRNFTQKTCQLPNDAVSIMLWDETLQKLRVSFLDNKLISLLLEFKVSEDNKAVYDKHGKHVLKLLGRPTNIGLTSIHWEKDDDEAILEDKKNGVITLQVINKTVHHYLSRSQKKQTN